MLSFQTMEFLPVDRDNFLSEIMDWTDNKGVELVLDPIGGEHLMQSYRCLGSGGRVCSFGISDMAPTKVKANGLGLNRG